MPIVLFFIVLIGSHGMHAMQETSEEFQRQKIVELLTIHDNSLQLEWENQNASQLKTLTDEYIADLEVVRPYIKQTLERIRSPQRANRTSGNDVETLQWYRTNMRSTLNWFEQKRKNIPRAPNTLAEMGALTARCSDLFLLYLFLFGIGPEEVKPYDNMIGLLIRISFVLQSSGAFVQVKNNLNRDACKNYYKKVKDKLNVINQESNILS